MLPEREKLCDARKQIALLKHASAQLGQAESTFCSARYVTTATT